jgi:hypothetical protein
MGKSTKGAESDVPVVLSTDKAGARLTPVIVLRSIDVVSSLALP